MTNEDKVKKWLAGELSDIERKEFESSDDFAEIHRLLKAVDNFKAPEYDVDSEYSRLSENIIKHKRPFSLYKRINPLLKIAAILIISLTISFFFYDSFNSSTNNHEWITEQTEVCLPDSSLVFLNKGAKIKFSKKEWSKKRNVELNGEAFFRVKEGSKFNVNTQHGTVTVLGTEFVVKDWDKYYEVICYSGLVNVSTKQNSFKLSPNNAYRFLDDKEERYTISNKYQPDWLNGDSSFKSVPLRFVINELKRQYKVNIEVDNVDLNQLFTGGFSHENLETALESITIPVNLNYQINGKNILITFDDK